MAGGKFKYRVALTKKQQKALKKVKNPSRRASLTTSFSAQNARPSAKTVALTTNAGPTTRTTPSFGNGRMRVPRGIPFWDANHHAHMPLPRSTGPYTVTRTTTRVTLDHRVTIFGSFRRKASSTSAHGEWSSAFAVADVLSTNPVNGLLNTTVYAHDMSGYGYETTVAPSAITVQLCNGEALQSTNGMSFVGVCSSQLGISNSPETWDVWGNRFVSTMKPRALSASTIAVSPKQVCSYPINLESLCDFTELTNSSSGTTFTWNDTVIEASGFAPIVVFNPGAANLEVLVTTEWRTRFSLSHPASSSHAMHSPTSEQGWHRALETAQGLGNGVVEVAVALGTAAEAVSRYRLPPVPP